MKSSLLLLAAVILFTVFAGAAPTTISPHIKIDQFGYFLKSKKVAVIVDPQAGYNAVESFNPGTGANQYQVRRWSDDGVAFTGTLVVWNGGATHAQSGDKGWWFDFTEVEAPGSYYIYDLVNNVGSYRFEIGTNVYDEVMKQAMRMFYYQRINFAKTAPYADLRWIDGACFERTNQDRFARLYTAKDDATTARDLHGGWMDAGDYNKYTTFAFRAVGSLLQTYRLHPTVFKDNYNIPESSNGIPDILDEIKWELDWLKRMQDATGTGGFLLKVGMIGYDTYYPPSADINPRYYVPECTSATLAGCAMFAMASPVYKSLGTPAMTAYGEDLLARAKAAWTRVKTLTKSSTDDLFVNYDVDCDNGTVRAGDADIGLDSFSNVQYQTEMLLTAAAYLYEATGEAEYKDLFESRYTSGDNPVQWWWGPYFTVGQRAMLHYTKLPGVSAAVASDIEMKKGSNDDVLSIDHYEANTDLYRSYMPDDQYHSGSNEAKGNAAIHVFDNINYQINSSNHAKYKEVGESYLHWYHGVNPMGKVMLTNMYGYGGDNCVNEIYHTWFADGSPWDNTSSSKGGPAPGYIINGPNKNFHLSWITPPYGQPAQKAYKEWNTVWNSARSTTEDSWEIAEPAIYTQAAYIGLLARVMASHVGEGTVLPLRFIQFTVRPTQAGAQLNWVVNETTNLQYYLVERSVDGRHFSAVSQVPVQPGQLAYMFIDKEMKATTSIVYYRIRAIYPAEEVVSAIRRISAQTNYTLTVSPNPATHGVWINSGSIEEGDIQVKIVNAAGAVLHKEQWVQPKGAFSKYISVEKLPVGTYWIRVQGAAGVETQKLLKK